MALLHENGFYLTNFFPDEYWTKVRLVCPLMLLEAWCSLSYQELRRTSRHEYVLTLPQGGMIARGGYSYRAHGKVEGGTGKVESMDRGGSELISIAIAPSLAIASVAE